jgi:peptide/nickel transport system permease protein
MRKRPKLTDPALTSAQSPALPSTTIVGRSPAQIAWMRFKRNKIGVIVGSFSIIVIILSLGAPIFSRLLGVDPNTLHLNVLDNTGVPTLPHGGISLQHPFGLIPGTGRDLLAQLLYGSRISFFVALVSTVLTLAIGLIIGILAGYFRGRVDAVIGRITDFLLSFPSFFMIVALSDPVVHRIEKAGLLQGNGARVLFLIIFLSFFGWPYFSRIIRSQALSLRERDFVTAAQAMGAKNSRIIFKELLPSLWTPVIIFVSLSLPGYIAAESVYSFLGLGVQPPASTWGILLSNSTRFVTVMPQFFLITAGSLVLVVLAFNLTGDALRDALDPRNQR